MKQYLFNTILLGFLFLVSCSKKEQIAPDLGAISSPVQFETAFAISNTSANFKNNGQVYFNASFKEETYWVITIKGNSSGAIKTIERSGSSGTEISQTNASWNGSVDGNSIAIFDLETAKATLSFPYSQTAPVSVTFNISAIK